MMIKNLRTTFIHIHFFWTLFSLGCGEKSSSQHRLLQNPPTLSFPSASLAINPTKSLTSRKLLMENSLANYGNMDAEAERIGNDIDQQNQIRGNGGGAVDDYDDDDGVDDSETFSYERESEANQNDGDDDDDNNGDYDDDDSSSTIGYESEGYETTSYDNKMGKQPGVYGPGTKPPTRDSPISRKLTSAMDNPHPRQHPRQHPKQHPRQQQNPHTPPLSSMGKSRNRSRSRNWKGPWSLNKHPQRKTLSSSESYRTDRLLRSNAAECFPVDVKGDAIFCIEEEKRCAGYGDLPIGWSCPKKGDVALSNSCFSHLPSWNSTDCVAPMDALCMKEYGAWGCQWTSDIKSVISENAEENGEKSSQIEYHSSRKNSKTTTFSDTNNSTIIESLKSIYFYNKTTSGTNHSFIQACNSTTKELTNITFFRSTNTTLIEQTNTTSTQNTNTATLQQAPQDCSSKVQVVQDAVFCVVGNPCSNQGDSCPHQGDVAISPCNSTFPSWDSQSQTCIAPSDAVCRMDAVGVWGCRWSQSSTELSAAFRSSSSTTSSSLQHSFLVGIVVIASVALGITLLFFVFRKNKKKSLFTKQNTTTTSTIPTTPTPATTPTSTTTPTDQFLQIETTRNEIHYQDDMEEQSSSSTHAVTATMNDAEGGAPRPPITILTYTAGATGYHQENNGDIL